MIQQTTIEEFIRKIESILIETGQHDLRFIGENKFSPSQVTEILMNHIDDLKPTD